MSVDFSLYTNYRNNAGVTGVVFGANAPLLEVELNEMQEIQKNELLNIIRNSFLEGERNGILKLDYENGTSDSITIKKGSAFLYDEVLLSLKEDITLERLEGAFYIILELKSHIGIPETFKEYGNDDSETNINDWAVDERYSEVTSMRKYTTFRFFTSISSSVSSGQYIIGRVDGSYFYPRNYWKDSNYYFRVDIHCDIEEDTNGEYYYISRSSFESLTRVTAVGNIVDVDANKLKCFVNGFEFPIFAQNTGPSGREATYNMNFSYDLEEDIYIFRFMNTNNQYYTYDDGNEITVVFPIKLKNFY